MIAKHAVVHWCDAYTTPTVRKDARDRGLESIASGFIVERNKKGIRLAMLMHIHEENQIEYRDGFFIPAGMIRKIVTAKVRIR